MPRAAAKATSPITTVITPTAKPVYDILPIDEIKYVERDDYIKSLCGLLVDGASDIVNTILTSTETKNLSLVEKRITQYANAYKSFSGEGARLPKFTKWVSGMFQNDVELANAVAHYGKVASNSCIVVSGDLLDILRVADSPHYVSCLGPKGPFPDVLKSIAEDCPGIAVVYVNDANGKMKGRCFINHATTSDGKDCVVVANGRYGCLDPSEVVRAFKAKGVEALLYVPPYVNDGVEVTYVNCFTKSIHYDTVTWGTDLKAKHV